LRHPVLLPPPPLLIIVVIVIVIIVIIVVVIVIIVIIIILNSLLPISYEVGVFWQVPQQQIKVDYPSILQMLCAVPNSVIFCSSKDAV